MKILALLLFMGVLYAETVYLRYGTPAGGVRITGISSGTPVRLTTNAAWTGLAANDYWIVSNENCAGVQGVFKVKAVTTTTLDLKTTADVDVPGCGGWTEPNRNYVNGKVRATSVTKFGILDGPGGATTRRLRCAIDAADPCLTSIVDAGNTATITVADGYTDELVAGVSKVGIHKSAEVNLLGTYTVQTKNDTTNTFTITTTMVPNATYTTADLAVSKVAYVGNPFWDRVLATTQAFWGNNIYEADPTGGPETYMAKELCAALHWFITRDGNSLISARHALLYPEDMAKGSTWCNEAVNGCDTSFRSSLDYSRFSVHNNAAAVRIICEGFTNTAGQCTNTEFANYMDRMFKSEYEGCTYPTRTASGGSLITTSGVTATGAALSALANGDTLILNTTGSESIPGAYRVGSGGGTSTLTMTRSMSAFTNTSAWSWAPRSTTSNCGIVEWLQHHSSSPLGWGGKWGPTGGPAGVLDFAIQSHNLHLSHGWAMFRVGMMFADKDARAKDWAERSFAYLYDYAIGYAMSRAAGNMQSGAAYSLDRSQNMLGEIAWVLKYQTDYPDLWDTWIKDFMTSRIYAATPYSTGDADRYGILFGQSPNSYRVSSIWEALTFPRMFPGSTEGANWRQWYYRQSGLLNAGWLAYDNGRWGWMGLIGWNPNEVPLMADPTLTAKVYTNSGQAVCAPLGMKFCVAADVNPAYAWAVSRTGFSMTGSDWVVSATGSVFGNDHDSWQSGAYRIQSGNGSAATSLAGCLMGDDRADCSDGSNISASRANMNTLDLGTYKNFLGFSGETGAYMDRAKVDASNRYATWRANIRRDIATVTLTRAYRWMAHMGKASGPGVFYIIDDVAGNSQSMKAYHHYTQNNTGGDGVTSCIGGFSALVCPSNQVLSQSTTSTIVSQYYFPSSGNLRVDNTSGSYTSGNGFTFRFTVGPTSNATIMETTTVHRLLTGTGTTTISGNQISPTGWMGAEAHGTAFLVARSDASPTTVGAFTTVGTADILVSGLAAGTYSLYSGVSETCPSIVVGTDQTLFCPSVPSGSITVAAPGSGTPVSGAGSRVGAGGRVGGGGRVN